jgi:hypothetical protein
MTPITCQECRNTEVIWHKVRQSQNWIKLEAANGVRSNMRNSSKATS